MGGITSALTHACQRRRGNAGISRATVVLQCSADSRAAFTTAWHAWTAYSWPSGNGSMRPAAYAVSQRASEIGIRMALGAQPGQVIALIMRSGLKLVAIGLVAGLAAAAGAARLIQTLFFDVQPLDPMVYGAVGVLFALVAALACLLPSLRASRIDPLVALRAG